MSLRQAFAHCARFPAAASRRSRGRVSVPVWLIVLSDQLPIVALVGRYPTNKLIGRGTILEWPKPFPLRAYAVLATVSSDYSPLQGRFPRVTHPSATRVSGASPGPSFDLHVLSMPPAFVLSQDQTLKLNSRTKSRELLRSRPCAQTFRVTSKRMHITDSPRPRTAIRTAACASLLTDQQCQRAHGRTPTRPRSHAFKRRAGHCQIKIWTRRRRSKMSADARSYRRRVANAIPRSRHAAGWPYVTTMI